MVKSELINTLGTRLQNLPGKDIEISINQILEEMSNALSRGDRIEIRGFGSFCLHYRPPRNAHNPKTGEKVATIAKYTPHFKPGKEMRERVNATYGKPVIDQNNNDDEDE